VSDSGAAFVAWTSRYDCEQADAQAVGQLLVDRIYVPGLARIKEMFQLTAR
jgi:hypothetical protein